MEILDVVLTNIVSYMGGIFTGLYIIYRLKQNREKENDRKDNRELDHMDNTNNNINDTPVLIPTAPAYPVTPPLMALNPEYVLNNPKPVTKVVFSTE